ncbi:MAG TPA: hypothetical protein VH253_06350 [Phycisphaerae bacterium]|nr:hypothetical protein [Phycisphaerae bacterium]
MSSFTDTQARKWVISLNVNAVRRVREGVPGVDLLKIMEDKSVIEKLTNDPFALVAVLYAVCEPQAARENVTPEGFADALGGGDTLAAAANALLDALADFFPPHRRGPMKAAIQKLQEIETAAARAAIVRIESPETMAAAVRQIESRLSAPPESSGA